MKTICIYHSVDLDGWMSAAIVKYWFEQKIEPMNRLLSSIHLYHTITFLGWNYGDAIPDLSKYDKVIMCDMSFPMEEMQVLLDRFKVDFIWIDHHVSAIDINKEVSTYVRTAGFEGLMAINGIRDTNFAACELTWKYFFPDENTPEIVRLLGMYDSFRHKGTNEELRVLEFQYGARACISGYEDAHRYLKDSLEIPDVRDRENVVKVLHLKGKAIYAYLCTEARQVYKTGFKIYLYEPVGLKEDGLNHTRRKFICINRERFNPVNFDIDYHADGYDGCACFYYANGVFNFSLYNDNNKVDCSAIARQYGGGGHKGAAGFRCDYASLSSFIDIHGYA